MSLGSGGSAHGVGTDFRMRPRLTWMTAVVVQASMMLGCSLHYTKGPEPEVHPPPACTESNDAPITDTVLAVASIGIVVAGSIVYSNTKNCGGWLCGYGNQLAGGGAILLGGVGTLVFVPSAIIGYSRTAACRAWLERDPKYAPVRHPRSGQPETSSLPAPSPDCHPHGDAPLLCAAGPRLATSFGRPP